FNLHKTFSSPHGGGGPGSGPVAVVEKLARFLPRPHLERRDGAWTLEWDMPDSIGQLHGFYGNFSMVVRAYTYVVALGAQGLHNLSERAVLNANYLRKRMEDAYPTAYPGLCMHEFVVTAKKFKKEHGIRAMDIAKRLIDLNFHPPTVYFPLVVPEAMMVEPTETESKQTLDELAEAFLQIAEEAATNPELLHQAPATTPVRRLDEARAVRKLKTRWTPSEETPSR
ncbi:MAG: aminomethyl-transferring glycine dehydrogenase subunit GcvPB, partial [Actinobacteria bacterium]|nr:aminomethyl-transferring glycine dehydrogenase subunit GcvPB [Actinomycetota bacterium]